VLDTDNASELASSYPDSRRRIKVKTQWMGCTVAAAALAAALIFSHAVPSAAQNQNSAKLAPNSAVTPRLTNGHPDLSGFWGGGGGEEGGGGGEDAAPPPTGVNNFGNHDLTRTASGDILFLYLGSDGYEGPVPIGKNQPPYKPEYMAKVKQIADTKYGGTTALDPMQDCKPFGIPRASVGNMQIVQNPQFMAVLYEAAPGPVYRIIYTDGRKHPDDLDTSYFGNSIGHWEGDVLVVDTVGLNDETWLGGDTRGADRFTSIHSDKEHVLEHWTREGNRITYEATVDDPVMFTKPWVITPKHARLASSDDYIQPQMCVNNDKAHIIEPTATDQFKCIWCNPASLYGDKDDTLSNTGGLKAGATTPK
jgi:hypothetical protein